MRSIGTSDLSQNSNNGGADGLVSKQAVVQLFETVKNLCATVGELSANVNKLMESVRFNTVSGESHESESLRLKIREEVREMEEREKRKCSIVIKGINVTNVSQVQEAFDNVRKYILGQDSRRIELVDVICIDSGKKL